MEPPIHKELRIIKLGAGDSEREIFGEGMPRFHIHTHRLGF